MSKKNKEIERQGIKATTVKGKKFYFDTPLLAEADYAMLLLGYYSEDYKLSTDVFRKPKK